MIALKSEPPPHVKKRITINENFFETKRLLSLYSANTVCESAKCPNITECFSKRRAAFLILGSSCARRCGFCSVDKKTPEGIDSEEPRRIAGLIMTLGLKYAIITSVTRDDLPYGGAGQFVKVIQSIRRASEDVKIEVLVPDFNGNREAIEDVVVAGPDVFGHNIETVKRLYPRVRPLSDYKVSLEILRMAKGLRGSFVTKSGIMVGLGERYEEVISTMEDLKVAGCDILTIGQYLRPTRLNLPVEEFVEPEEFERYRKIGYSLGFKSVSSGPFVRSSYFAEEAYNSLN